MYFWRFLNHARILTPLRYLVLRKKAQEKAGQTLKDFDLPYSETLCRDMVRKYCAHRISMAEYLLFDCGQLSYRQIEQIIGSRELVYWIWKLNDFSQKKIFDNKYETYCRFKKYYGRQVIRIFSNEDLNPFTDFVLSHEKIVVKPIAGHSGTGVQMVQASTARQALGLFNLMRMQYPKGFVAEEPIRQCMEMADFHPQSVNTVRMATIRHDNYVTIWHPFFRTGQGCSIVDNSGNGGIGGIETLIDPNTGRLKTGGDMTGRRYLMHPESHKPLQGYQIPRWNEAVALAKELAQVVPEMRYIGWDLALTDHGWVMVEGNGAAQMAQNVDGVGLKAEFIKEIQLIRLKK